MKNGTYSYTYTVKIKFTHPTQDLSTLADKLAKIPGALVGKGIPDSMRNKELPKYGDLQSKTVSLEFEEGWLSALINPDLPAAIRQILDAILPYKFDLVELVNGGGAINIRVGLSHQSNIGTALTEDIIEAMAALKISIDFFLYVSDEFQAKYNERIDRVGEAVRKILHKYDPSGILKQGLPLSGLHLDPYQDLFYLIPKYIESRASAEVIAEELREELAYFTRTNTEKLKEFTAYDALATELSGLDWEKF